MADLDDQLDSGRSSLVSLPCRDRRLYEPSPRTSHYAASVKDHVFVICGLTEHYMNHNTVLPHLVEICEPLSKKWFQTLTRGTPPPGLYNGACTSIDGKIYTYGGYIDHGYPWKFSDTLSVLDTNTMAWKHLDPSPSSDPIFRPIKKRATSMVAYESEGSDKLALIGGYGLLPESISQSEERFFHPHVDGFGWTSKLCIFDIKNRKSFKV